MSSSKEFLYRTGYYIRLLRKGTSYDDSSGCMVENKLLLEIMNATEYNFRRMSSFSILKVLQNYFTGFERIDPENCDADAIKNAVLDLVSGD